MATSTPVLIVGPIPGGNPFNDGTYTGIRSMKIEHGDIGVSIQTEYDRNGQSVWSPMHGTNNDGAGTTTDEIKLDYPDEFLVSVSGTSTVEFPTVIRTLTIQSNKKTYGPYGTVRAGAQSFSTKSTGCKIVGFHGRSGVVMESIGTYLVPQDKILIGPFGGDGKYKYDVELNYPSTTKLQIRRGEGFVSMQTVHATANDQNQCSAVHGQKAGGIVAEVDLSPDEYYTSLSGYYSEGSNPVIQTITFQTNKATYGPYPVYEPLSTAQGIPFSTSTTVGTGKIVGFQLTSDSYIKSVAAYFEPLP